MNKELIIIPIVFFTIWFSIIFLSGSATSGYHFMDDHQILEFKDQIEKEGLISTLYEVTKKDLQIRLRPVYCIQRVVIVYIFGDNFLLWHIYRGMLAVFCSCFLYFGARNLKVGIPESLLFTFLTLFGYHTSIWIWLGPSEAIGMVLFSIAFYFFVKFLSTKKTSHITFFILAILFSVLSKESFLISIPGIIILLIFHSSNNNYRKPFLISIVSLLMILIICLISIFFSIGSNSIGYAGIENQFPLLNFIQDTIWSLLKEKTNWLLLIGILLMVFSGILNTRKNKNDLFRLIISLVILFSFIIPQFILYYKSGFFARYIIPLYFFYALYILYVLKSLIQAPALLRYSYIFLIFIFVVSRLFLNALPITREYAETGLQTKELLNEIIMNTKKEDSFLIVCNVESNYENGPAIRTYLTLVKKKNEIDYYLTDETSKLNVFNKKLWDQFHENNENLVKENPEILKYKRIVIFEDSKEPFVALYNDYLNKFFEQKKIVNKNAVYYLYKNVNLNQ